MTALKDISDAQQVSFGTSGVRALVTDLSHEICYQYAHAFIESVVPDSDRVAVGIDLRPSSKQIALSMIQAIEDSGRKVIYCGEIPTPALAFYGLQKGIPSIMITGSHIPFDRNGFKFYTASGEITKQDEVAILSYEVAASKDLVASALLQESADAKSLWIERYMSFFPEGALSNQRIGLYEHSSAARDLLKLIFTQLGAEVISLDRTDYFVPIDTEAVSEDDQKKAYSWSNEHQLDAIVSTDGDGDRPLLADESGQWLRGDLLGILVSQLIKATHVACPVNVNTALESSSAIETLRTKIGSPYVIEAMGTLAQDKSANVVGFEANGGFLVGNTLNIEGKQLDALPTRDSFLPILMMLVIAAQSKSSISELVSRLPERYTASDRIKDIPTVLSQSLIDSLKSSEESLEVLLLAATGNKCGVADMNEIDGLRLTLSTGDIIHLRPSGNAPELRCYAESSSYNSAKLLVSKVLHFVQTMPR